MKTTKHNLSAIAMGVALAMGSASVLATPNHPVNPSQVGFRAAAQADRLSQNPTFESAERTGLALVESSLSLIAGRTHFDSNSLCPTRVYNLKVTTDDADFGDNGTAVINDGAGGTVKLHAYLSEDDSGVGGAFVDLHQDEGYAKLYGVDVSKYEGHHSWSRNNNIFVDSASWTFTNNADNGNHVDVEYSENSIKDYYERIEDVQGDTEAWEYDWGFETIHKHHHDDQRDQSGGQYHHDGVPVAKWNELSWYRQDDGVDGFLKVKKELIEPETKKAGCRIVYKSTSAHTPFEHTGVITVSKP
jgi:hypothetical protein